MTPSPDPSPKEKECEDSYTMFAMNPHREHIRWVPKSHANELHALLAYRDKQIAVLRAAISERCWDVSRQGLFCPWPKDHPIHKATELFGWGVILPAYSNSRTHPFRALSSESGGTK